MKKIILVGALLVAQSAELKELELIEDGISIQRPGYFMPGCYYGDEESLSDHAPVLYNHVGTWNLTTPINNYAIQPDKKSIALFYNHKFHTNKEGDLVDREGSIVGSSEISASKIIFNPQKIKKLLSDNNINYLEYLIFKGHKNLKEKNTEANKIRASAFQELADDQEENYKNTIILLEASEEIGNYININYVNRIKKIIDKIKELFLQNKNLNYLLLQEIPGLEEETVSGENIQALIKEALESSKRSQEGLRVAFYEPAPSLKTFVSKSSYKKELNPDVAIIYRAQGPELKQVGADHDNRLVSWCAMQTQSCYISVHMPHAGDNKELKTRCRDIKNMAIYLKNKGYKNMSFAGDFNMPAYRIIESCEDILKITNTSIKIHSSEGDIGNSCGSNEGHVAKNNIDLLLEYNFN